MRSIHVVLSTNPKDGKGGVATVVPLYIEILSGLGKTIFIPTHKSTSFWGKFYPWIASFFSCAVVVRNETNARKFFHVHPGSGLCLLRMLGLTIFLRLFLRQHVFVYLHTPYLERYLQSNLWRRIIESLIRLSTRTIALTDYARNLLEREGMAEDVLVIPNPFRSDFRGAVAKDNDVCRVLVMGRIVPGKGFKETLLAFANLPARFRLVVAGEGPLLEEIRAEALTQGLSDRVEWMGWVTGDDKHRLLQQAHVFCLPSRVDSFGMSFVEAQCYDLPVVAFRHPPVMEVIRPEQSVIVDDLDPTTLSRAINTAGSLIELIHEGSGRAWIEARFGLNHVGKFIEQMVEESYR